MDNLITRWWRAVWPFSPWRIVAEVDAADEVPDRLPRKGAVLVGSRQHPKWIAFDCPCGPAEVVRNGVDGLLVPNGDVGALAGAMERMMSDEALRDILGRAGTDARVRFGIDTVSAMWRPLFDEALAPYGKRRPA